MFRVNDIFFSIQAEGHYIGSPAVFVRFAGCNRRCSFCTTDHTVKMTFDEPGLIARIGEEARLYRCNRVVLTGGEPALQVDEAFVERLGEDLCVTVHMRTNGTVKVPRNLDWLTVSPKDSGWNFFGIEEIIDSRMDEVVVPVTGPYFSPPVITRGGVHPYLCPVKRGSRLDPGALSRAVAIVRQGLGWRLTLQANEIWKVR